MVLEENREDKMVIESNEVIERTEEKMTLLDNNLRRKDNWIHHILRINYHLRDISVVQIMEVK